MSAPEILPVFDENSVDVDDPEIAPALTSLASPSSELQVPSNHTLNSSSGMSSLPQIAPALASSTSLSSEASHHILDSSSRNSSLLQIASPLTSLASLSPEFENTPNLILGNSSGNSSLPQKKRYYREEWKIVQNDKKATEDRIQNLVIDAKDPWGMWCKACTQFAAELGSRYLTNFVKDFSQFKPPRPKKETVNIHFSSHAHAKCSEKAKVYKQPSTSAPIYQQITEINSQTLKKMENIMRIVFYFAIKDRAGNEFSSECHLQKLNGVDLGNTYQNNSSFNVLLKYVAMFFQRNVINELNKAQFISIMTDGSTTKKSTEYEAVVIRHINNENLITNSFIGLCSIKQSNAAGIADVITNCLDSSGLTNWKEKLICMTVDGAAVNVGKFNGLVNLIAAPMHIHCFNHVLDLCLKDSIKGNAAAQKTVAFVKALSSFYRCSPKLTRELSRAAEALGIKILSFKPVCETRWADSLENVVLAVITNFNAIVQHLTDISEHFTLNYASSIKSTAKGLLADLTTYETLHFFMLFLILCQLFQMLQNTWKHPILIL